MKIFIQIIEILGLKFKYYIIKMWNNRKFNECVTTSKEGYAPDD